MKKILVIFIIALNFSCSPKPKAIIKGDLINLENQTAYLAEAIGVDRELTYTDSVEVVDGKFTFILDNTTPRRASILFSKSKPYFNIVVEEGTLTIEGDFKKNTSAKICGTFIADKINELKERQRPLTIERMKNNELNRKISAENKELGLSAEETAKRQADIKLKFKEISQNLKQIEIDMIEENKDNLFSVYQNTLITPVTVRETDEIMAKIPASFRDNEFYSFLVRRRAALAKVDEGAMAPDFTSTTIDGEKFTLSSTRGKVVILNTWGSTCISCIAHNRSILKLYNKYKHKGLEVVAVSFERPTAISAWKRLVECDNLGEWINVTNAQFYNCPIYNDYLFIGAGNQILIDREGRIALRLPDSDEELEAKIRELL